MQPFILTLNHADVIGDQSDALTQNAWFRCMLCAAISGEILILIQTGAESWGRFPVPIKNLPLGEKVGLYICTVKFGKLFYYKGKELDSDSFWV